MADYCVMTPDVHGHDPVHVTDCRGDMVDGLTREQGLTSEQAQKVEVMINRAFQKGFDQCGSQIRELIGS